MAEIIGAVLLIGLTLVAGILLWSFRIYTPQAPPTVGFVFRSGGSNPVWGDPTDVPPGGGYSLMNTSQIIVAQYSPTGLSLNDFVFTFVCDNSSSGGPRTVLVTGTLASMTWFPGSSTTVAPNAPTLGWCATFHAGGFGGGAFGTYYNRLGLFVPISQGATTIQTGDTFLLYIHSGCAPLDYRGNTPVCDNDDYHGAPPWCFTTPGSCTIYISYVEPTSSYLLATIPVYSLAPPAA